MGIITFSAPSLLAAKGAPYYKYGYAPDIDTGTVPFDIWDGPTAIYPWPAAAAATTIQSASVNDTLAGTGAQMVQIFGVGDAPGYATLTEVISLNGVAAVPLANQYFRINRMRVVQAGALLTNNGIISAQHGAVVISVIGLGPSGLGRGSTLQTMYTLAGDLYSGAKAGQVSYNVQRQAVVSVEAAFKGRFPTPGGSGYVSIDTQIIGLNSQGTGYLNWDRIEELSTDVVISPGTDLWVRAENVSANNTAIAAFYTLELIPA